MMARATIVEESNEELDRLDDIETETVEEEVAEPVDEIPEKYQGKSIAEVAKMHQEVEQLVGRQSAEVGELRRLVDDFVRNQPSPAAPKEDELEEADFFTDPKAAVSKAVASHPKIKAAEAALAAQQQEVARQTLSAKHPDVTQVIADPKFQEWVSKSKVRTSLFQAADQQYNYEAADELLSSWKELNQAVQVTAEAEKQSRKAQAKAASTGSGRSAQGTGRKKIYRRADVIKLMVDDPHRYQTLQPEIMQAYAEGRVK